MSHAETIHATCVATSHGAVLIVGTSGSGKSDLALRLIDRGARLVSDDRVEVRQEKGRLIAASPGVMFGKIEVRAVGICDVSSVPEAEVTLLVRLGEEGDRLPDDPSEMICGIALPLLRIDPHRASAPIKVEMAIAQGVGRT